jgi:mono/diheme cytochrome c family protein
VDLCRQVVSRGRSAAWIFVALAAALCLQSCALAQQPAQPAASSEGASTPKPSTAAAFTPEQTALGRKIYGAYCTRCHGINMAASSAAFFDLRTFPEDAKERFTASINNGLRAMPAWKDTLKPEEVEALWAYVVSNKPK